VVQAVSDQLGPGSILGSVLATLVVDNVALGQIFFFLPVLRFSPLISIPPMLHAHSYIYHRRRQPQQPSASSNATLRLTTITSYFPPVFRLCGRSAKQAVSTLNKPMTSDNQQLSDKIMSLHLYRPTRNWNVGLRMRAGQKGVC
jgi:hypothetical protein